MNFLLYHFMSGLIRLIRVLPLETVARIARFCGGLFFYLDTRHRRVAVRNLTLTFPEKSRAKIRAMARENFRRIGENFICPVKMIYMNAAERASRVEFRDGAEKLYASAKNNPQKNIIVAIGHFGNFELMAHVGGTVPDHRAATTYRAIRNPAADRILLQLRHATGCLYFERRTEGSALREALHKNNLVLGLLSDQHSGDHGLRLPFLGRDCNTSKAPALFALRYNAPLHVAISYRTGLARWSVEVSDPIPTENKGRPRLPSEIMLDVNRLYEAAVLRDPANWFWVHNRWKQSRLKPEFPNLAPTAPIEDGKTTTVG